MSLKLNSCDITDSLSLISPSWFSDIGFPPLESDGLEGRWTERKLLSSLIAAFNPALLICTFSRDFSFFLTNTCKSYGFECGRDIAFSNREWRRGWFSKLKETCFFSLLLSWLGAEGFLSNFAGRKGPLMLRLRASFSYFSSLNVISDGNSSCLSVLSLKYVMYRSASSLNPNSSLQIWVRLSFLSCRVPWLLTGKLSLRKHTCLIMSRYSMFSLTLVGPYRGTDD